MLELWIKTYSVDLPGSRDHVTFKLSFATNPVEPSEHKNLNDFYRGIRYCSSALR